MTKEKKYPQRYFNAIWKTLSVVKYEQNFDEHS